MNRWPAALALFFTACTSAPVDMTAPRRVVGTESAVRVDAEIRGEEIRPGSPVPITYEITNQRDQTIAVAEVVSVTTYDSETQTITVNIGSEVPGLELLPHLITIAPGEKKSFSTAARVAAVTQVGAAGPRARYSAGLRLKVNFLGDTTPFAELLNIPEKAVADAKRADALFGVWLDRNEVVYTNAVPMRFSLLDPLAQPAQPPAPTRRGRRPQ